MKDYSFHSNRFRLQSYEKKRNYANSFPEKSFYFASPANKHHPNDRPTADFPVQFPYYSRTIPVQ